MTALFPTLPEQRPPATITAGGFALIWCQACDGTEKRPPTWEEDDCKCWDCNGGGRVLRRVGQ